MALKNNDTDMRKLLREKWRRIVFLILMSLCIIPDTDMQPILSPALALFAGIVVANTMGNPFEKLSREAVKTLLKIAIVGLGFGIHADKAMQAGGKGVDGGRACSDGGMPDLAVRGDGEA